jgi:anaerobic nitric oxide reductase transcription regulator
METNAIKMTPCCRAVDAFLSAASVIPSKRNPDDRHNRLFEALFSVLPCDAAVLLTLSNDNELVPIAVKGFRTDILGKRFKPTDHPRLKAILGAAQPLSFGRGNHLPNPFTDFFESPFPVQAEMGCALAVDDGIVGALVIDFESSETMRRIDARELSLFATLAAANLKTIELVDSLDALARKRGMVSKHLIEEARHRGGGELLGQSPQMRQLKQEIQIVADADLIVLITGETGTGKELVARSVHAQSSRADEPLIYVNCAALPESIAESELFGHVKGAYTGADASRVGKFELADGGTLFLDEIGELPLSVQPKLLRAIQSGEIQRLGSDKNAQVDVRIIAATNRNLKKEVEAGRFRIDLYHRISVYPIEVPPLRGRGGDISLLAGHFLEQARSRLRLGPARITTTALAEMLRYDWPGNVRELDHVVTRSVLRATKGRLGESVSIDDFHLDLGENRASGPEVPEENPLAEDPTISLKESVIRHKRKIIAEAVRRAGGNWAEAARRLKLHRSNLYRTARQVGLKVSQQ